MLAPTFQFDLKIWISLQIQEFCFFSGIILHLIWFQCFLLSALIRSASTRILFWFQDLHISPDPRTLVLSGIIFHLIRFQSLSVISSASSAILVWFQDLDFSPGPGAFWHSFPSHLYFIFVLGKNLFNCRPINYIV